MAPRSKQPAASGKQKKPRPKVQPPKPLPPEPIPDPDRLIPAVVLAFILDRLSSGESLNVILPRHQRALHLPSRTRFLRHVVENRPLGLADRYARAREAGAWLLADEILQIADDSSQDWLEITKPDGSVIEIANHEHINRSKLRVDVRRFHLAKLVPRTFGEKLDLTTDGKSIAPGVMLMPPLDE